MHFIFALGRVLRGKHVINFPHRSICGRYGKVKEEELDRIFWRSSSGRGYEPVVRQTMLCTLDIVFVLICLAITMNNSQYCNDRSNDWIYIEQLNVLSCHLTAFEKIGRLIRQTQAASKVAFC